MAPLFADVILPLPLREVFTYSVPPGLEDRVVPGVRVAVPFGPGRHYAALVVALHREAPAGRQVRPVLFPLDDRPVAGEEHLRFWEWMARYYLCSTGEVMKAALPPGMKLESETYVTAAPSGIIPCSDEEKKLLDLLGTGRMRIGSIGALKELRHPLRLLKQLVEKQAVVVEERLSERHRPRQLTMVAAGVLMHSQEQLETALATLKRAPRQRALLRRAASLLAPFTPGAPEAVEKKTLLAEGGFTEALLSQLVARNMLVVRSGPPAPAQVVPPPAPLPPPGLQLAEALDRVRAQLNPRKPLLLHTGNRELKKELFLHLAAGTAAEGKQLLWLVPGITQAVRAEEALRQVFGSGAGFYHSGLGDARRVEMWYRVRGDGPGGAPPCRQILGTRSALFLPFPAPGLIIVDDEQDPSYKQQDPAPRYHARDMAVVLGSMLRVPVLLASATPSFESYHNTRTGKYGLVTLPGETAPAALVMVEGIREARKRRTLKHLLTQPLRTAIGEALANHEQVLLYHDRRGYAPFPECGNCGWVPQCPRCDVTLTYHKQRALLTCHYCGHTLPMPAECSRCHSPDLLFHGTGTEKVEEEVALLFPGARIARVDADTVRGRSARHTVIPADAGIIVGTRMVTGLPGLDRVSVVGILNAGILLNQPDFRAFERAFQLFRELQALAAPPGKQGLLIIQLSREEHPVTSFLAAGDYEGFFNQYNGERKLFSYPPWYRLIKILVRHRMESRAGELAGELAATLRQLPHLGVMGPQTPQTGRLRGLHAREIWLKIPRESSRETIHRAVASALDRLRSSPAARGASLQADVDAL